MIQYCFPSVFPQKIMFFVIETRFLYSFSCRFKGVLNFFVFLYFFLVFRLYSILKGFLLFQYCFPKCFPLKIMFSMYFFQFLVGRVQALLTKLNLKKSSNTIGRQKRFSKNSFMKTPLK